jgi:hypothetical protein
MLFIFASIIFIFALIGCESRESSSIIQIPLSTLIQSPTVHITETPTQPLREILTLDQFRERWLSGVICMPPCWEGIYPGVTNSMEALHLLESNVLLSNIQTGHFTGTGFITSDIQFLDEDGMVNDWNVEVYYKYASTDETIYGIKVGFPPTPLSIFLQSYGTPSHAVSFVDDRATPGIWTIRIVWDAIGLQMWTFGQGENPRIDGNLVFESANYFQPGLEGYQTLFGQEWVNILIMWQGFSDFSTYQYQEPYLFPGEATLTP